MSFSDSQNPRNQTQTGNLDIEKTTPRVIHVYVALCDKDNQGIISSNPKLENGEDLENNQYWGALYGVKNYFQEVMIGKEYI